MKLSRFAWALCAACVASVAVQAQEPLTLQQVLDRVLARYPTLDAAQAGIDAAKARSQEANAARLPQVSGSANYTYTAPRPYIQFGPTSFYESTQNVYTTGVTAQQLITDFGRTDALVALARSGELSAQDALAQARSQLGYEAIQAFYDVILLRQSVMVANDEIRALQEALRISDRRFAGGTVTKFDVLTTQVRLSSAQNNLTDTQASLEKEEALMRQLLGLDLSAPLDLQGGFPSPNALPDLSSAIAAGLENRPEMEVARDQVHTADLQLRVADRANRPSLSASATGGMENGQLPSLYANRGYVLAGASLSIPIFTGGRITGERREARAGVRSAQARVDELTRKIATDVSDAFSDLRAAQARLASADLLVDQSHEAVALAQTRYANGVITNFELLDAQSAARNAELARVQARYRWTLARQALSQASGEPAHP